MFLDVLIKKLSNVQDSQGRQTDQGLEVSTVQHHMANSLHTSVYAAVSLPSMRGQMTGLHCISSSVILCSHSSSHRLILHRALTFLADGADVSWQEDTAWPAWCPHILLCQSDAGIRGGLPLLQCSCITRPWHLPHLGTKMPPQGPLAHWTKQWGYTFSWLFWMPTRCWLT